MILNNEIQGLRAVAVLAVVLTHLQISWITGGFVGVDIFFVISGYLITAMLASEIEKTGSVSLFNFYQRRVRRLFPAMAVTCIFTLLAGFLIFSDEHFEPLINSTLAAFFSVSNIYFWSQVGYFDAEAAVKPLLHTWSLGVEAQFYLIWPALILFALKGKSNPFGIGFIAVLGLSSFLINWLFIVAGVGDGLAGDIAAFQGFLSGGSTAFYQMPFRIFEFSIGAAIYILKLNHSKINPTVADTLFFLAFANLVFLMTTLSKESVFPYYNALWVSLLTGVLISVSKNSPAAQAVLGYTPMVFVGGLSYSLYLVHWPLIVYYQAVFGELDNIDTGMLMVLMALVALALNVFVENKFRSPPPANNKKNLLGLLSKSALPITLLFSVLGVVLIGSVEGRIPEHRETYTNYEWRQLRNQKYCQGSIQGFPEKLFTCVHNRNSEHTVVVWGDSHGLHLVAGLAELYDKSNVAVAFKAACTSQSGFDGYVRKFESEELTQQCINRNNDFLEWAKRYHGEGVVFISNAKRSTPEVVAPINNQHIKILEDYGHRAFVIGDFIRPGVELAQCFAAPALWSDEMLVKRCMTKSTARELNYSKQLEALSINYIPVHRSQCPNDRCRFLDDSGRVTYRDVGHLSYIGSIYEVGKASELIAAQYSMEQK